MLSNLRAVAQFRDIYLNSFADKSILDMQVFGEDASKYTVILSYVTGNDYRSDAFRTREISFLKMEISKSEDFFQELKKAMENVTTLMPVNYKSQTSSAIAYSDFALEGMPVTNSFAIADINNDGLNDIVGVGSNTSDTWNGQAILNFYSAKCKWRSRPVHLSGGYRGQKLFFHQFYQFDRYQCRSKSRCGAQW